MTTQERKVYFRKYYQEHKKEIRAYAVKWFRAHPGYCTRKALEWKKKNPEKWKMLVERNRPKKRIRDMVYARKRRADHPGLKTKEYAEWRRTHREAYRAHRIVNSAIKKGTVKRSSCEVCGEDRKYRVHAHHDDYRKPLQVRWLCVPHHKQQHNNK